MELILILGLGAAVFTLWGRIQKLEERLGRMEGGAPERARQTGVTYRRGSPWGEALREPVEEPLQRAMPEEPEPEPVEELQSLPPEPAFPPAEQGEPAAQELGQQRDSWVNNDAEPVDEYAPEPAARWSLDFEDLFGRRLPIWLGGITLAVAGLFVVRFAIEAGILTPPIRVALSMLFGLGLLAGAEWAYRAEDKVADPRVRQALGGAGLSTLYASFYLAGSFYNLISPAAAFIGLAGITAGAILLSRRFGVPCAVLGLVGGFATPLLTGSTEANVPLLAIYLVLLTSGLTVEARARRWAWLGQAALGGGLLWGLALLASAAETVAGLLAVGGLVLFTGALLPQFVRPASRVQRRLGQIIAAAVAVVQIAALVTLADFSLLSWGLLALAGVAFAVLGWRKPDLRRASGFAGVLAAILMLGWDAPDFATLTLLTGAFAFIFAAVPLAHIWRREGGALDAVQLGAVTLLLFGAFAWQAAWLLHDSDVPSAVAGFLLAALPLLAAWRLWSASGERIGWAALGLSAVAAVLLFSAIAFLAPAEWLVLVAAALAAGWLWLARGRQDGRMLALGWAGAAFTFLMLVTFASFGDAERFIGESLAGPNWFAALRWGGAGALFAVLGRTEHRRQAGQLAALGAALLFYGAGAQVIPAGWLAWFAALSGVAVIALFPAQLAAIAVFGGIALLWMAEPLANWAMPALLSLTGKPMLATAVPEVRELAFRILPATAMALLALLRLPKESGVREPALVVGGITLLVIVHSLFKQLFGISDTAEFARAGLAERLVWEALLLGGAALSWRTRGRAWWLWWAAVAAGGAALLHWVWYTLLLHNPLMAQQLVGPVPVLNFLLPLYAIGIGAALWLRELPVLKRARPVFDSAVMLLVILLAFSLLRQVFAGSFLPAVPVGQTESLAQSVLGIALAFGFVGWGTRMGQRRWRIGSLVLMLLAVGKVFLLDAAALTGLLRIASFAALGFSLIAIGWFYSKQLKR